MSCGATAETEFLLDDIPKTLASLVENNGKFFLYVHIVLTCLGIKNAFLKSTAQANPLACYIIGIAFVQFGGLVGSGLLMDTAPIETLLFGKGDPCTLLFYTIIWWLTFYSPYNVFYRILSGNMALKAPMLICEELFRSVGVMNTVIHSRKIYSAAKGYYELPFALILGTAACAGGGYAGHWSTFITDAWNGELNLKTGTFTKAGLLYSALHFLFPQAKYIILLFEFITMSGWTTGVLAWDAILEEIYGAIGGKITNLAETPAPVVSRASSKRSRASSVSKDSDTDKWVQQLRAERAAVKTDVEGASVTASKSKKVKKSKVKA